MAIDLTVTYPTKVNPASPAWPFGQPRNITAPGDGTGTPWEQAIIRDSEGFKQALLSVAGVTPSGTPDTAQLSQYLQSLLKISGLVVANLSDAVSFPNLVDGIELFTLGRNTIGDGGHAKYRYRSAGGGGNDGVAFINHAVSGDLQLLPENGELNAIAGGAQVAPTNSSAAVLACITAANANGWKLVFPGKSFKFTVTASVPCEIECRAGFSVEPAASGDTAALRFVGTASGTTYQLTGAAARFQQSLTATVSASDIVAGDYFVLQDDKERASDSAKQINMEVHRAKTVAGAVITPFDFVREQKDATATNIYKVTMVSGIKITGWRYTGVSGSTANTGLYFDMCENVRIYGLRGRSIAAPALQVRRCFDVAVYSWDLAEPQAVTSGQGYGLSFLQGSTKIHVGAGIGKGLRHTVDYDSCWDITSDWYDSIDAQAGDVLLAHNGWGGDIQSQKVRARGGLFQTVYVPLPATAGATAYTKSIPNIHVEVDSELPLSAGGVAFQSEQPIIDSTVDSKSVHGDGSKPTSFTSGAFGVRIPADKSKGSRVKIKCRGASAALFRSTASAGFGDAVFDITAVNCYQTSLVQDSTEVNFERVYMDNIHASAMQYDGVNTLQKMVIGPVSADNLNSTLTAVPAARIHANGCNGRIGPVTDSSSGAKLTLGAGFTISMDQLLRTHDGETILVTAAGAVTSAATAFPDTPIYNGQRITLVTDQTTNTITIQHATNVQNDGAASVVLGTAKRSATWVGDTLLGRWYQVA